MSIKLYVGNLPYSTTEEELKNYFSEKGEVTSAIVIIDRDSGRSKGFGFVEMANDDEGKQAINDLNGKDYEGKTLTVNEARPREERRPYNGGGNKPRKW